MTIRVPAVYEKGILRLKDPLSLPEGTPVEVVVIRNGHPSAQQQPAAILSEIAAMPLEPGRREFAGRDHDAVLYGDQEKL